MLGPMLDKLGYSKLGLGVEQAKTIRGMPREELEVRVKAYREGKTSLGLDATPTKAWTDFNTQMEFAGREIENVFAKGLVLDSCIRFIKNDMPRLKENGKHQVCPDLFLGRPVRRASREAIKLHEHRRKEIPPAAATANGPA
jgi:hypothetical protein